MKRINLKFLLIFITLVVVGAASVFFLRRFQVRRNAGNLASLAKQRLDEGKPAEAIMRRFVTGAMSLVQAKVIRFPTRAMSTCGRNAAATHSG